MSVLVIISDGYGQRSIQEDMRQDEASGFPQGILQRGYPEEGFGGFGG